MTSQRALSLPARPRSETVWINARCGLRAEDGQRVVVVAGLPVHQLQRARTRRGRVRDCVVGGGFGLFDPGGGGLHDSRGE